MNQGALTLWEIFCEGPLFFRYLGGRSIVQSEKMLDRNLDESFSFQTWKLQ